MYFFSLQRHSVVTYVRENSRIIDARALLTHTSSISIVDSKALVSSSIAAFIRVLTITAWQAHAVYSRAIVNHRDRLDHYLLLYVTSSAHVNPLLSPQTECFFLLADAHTEYDEHTPSSTSIQSTRTAHSWCVILSFFKATASQRNRDAHIVEIGRSLLYFEVSHCYRNEGAAP